MFPAKSLPPPTKRRLRARKPEKVQWKSFVKVPAAVQRASCWSHDLVETLKSLDEAKFREEIGAKKLSEFDARWKEYDHYWTYTKLKADMMMPGASNRGAAGPRPSDLLGARVIRANFANGSKAIATDIFQYKNKPEKPKSVFAKQAKQNRYFI